MTNQQQIVFGRLAIEGGQPVFSRTAPLWPPQSDEIKAALDSAWQSGDWGRYEGAATARLMEQLSGFHSGCQVVLCSSGTIAVELALRGLGVGIDDEVVLAGYDFPGNFRAVEAIGAHPVLADLQPNRWTVSVEEVERVLTPAVRAVLVSHLHGDIVDMPTLLELCGSRNIAIVEDVCQAPGAELQQRRLGTWGDVAVWSFGGSKLLTSGRGGAILTSRPDIAQRIRIFAERGNQAFPLSELQAAVLIPQLDHLRSNNLKRSSSVAILHEELSQCSWICPLPSESPERSGSYYKVAWLYRPTKEHSRDEFVRAARAEGVAIDAGFRGFVQRSDRRCRRPRPLTESQIAAERTIILHHPILLADEHDVRKTAWALKKIGQAWQLDD